MRLINIGIVAKKFKDTFIRPNETLSRSSDGSLWNIIRGSWEVLSNRLSTSSSPNTYPIASTTTPSENVDISIKDVSQGTTAALWITDSGNWWGLGIDRESLTQCETCYNYDSFIYNYPCGTTFVQNCNAFSCASWTYTCNSRTCNGNCKSWTNQGGVYRCANWFGACCVSTTNCTGGYNICNAFYSTTNTNYCQAVGYNITGSYQCNCVTSYPQYIRFIQSVSNTVSVISQNAVSSVIGSIKVLVRKTGSNSATVTTKAYSDTELVSQIGNDIVYVPSNIAITPNYGIIVKPSSYSQGSTSGEIEIESI